MARTPLFRALRRIFRDAAVTAAGSGMPRRLSSRRSFLAMTAAGFATAACPRASQTTRVLVVGAGLAGLHAAYRLQQAGLDVSVFEASNRVGGRIWTGRDLFSNGHTCELGGELIDSNHRNMLGLCAELDLAVVDRFGGDYAPLERDTWWAGGLEVPESALLDQFREVAPALLAAMTAADEDEGEFDRLNEMSLADFLEGAVPAADYPALSSILVSAYRGEFGLEVADQSALNLIYLIGSDDTSTFRIFGESDERYHVATGNDSIATALAAKLGSRIALSHRLTKATRLGDASFELTLEAPSGPVVVSGTRLVLALPFTILRTIDISGLGLSDEKQEIISQLGYGTNAKLMAHFSERLWVRAGKSGSATTDLPFQQTWDSSIGQPGTAGILTNFVGGARGLAVGADEPEAQVVNILSDVDRVFPGLSSRYVAGSAVRMHWPTFAHALGSYACYRPGQWAYWGLEGAPERGVHFCGEHTSPEFQGWMEGAAETGGRVAAEILRDLGLPFPTELAALLDDLTPLPGQEPFVVTTPKGS